MIFQSQLRIPGPTPIPDRVVRSMSRPMVDHRGPEFAEVLAEVVSGVKKTFGTEHDLLAFTASGSGGLEAAVANMVSPGDKVIACVCGNFGERFASIAASYGCHVVRLEVEWGQPIEPADLEAVLEAHSDAKVVLVTHNETSTGLTNPLADLALVCRRSGRLLVVDGVSSVSSIPFDMDAHGIDVAVTASQKGFMAPPGLTFLAIGPRAWEQYEQATAPRYYFDWKQARKALLDRSTPFTPALTVFYAMQEGLRMLQEEGLENVYTRHERLADAAAAGVEAMGFRLFAAERFRSAVVTAAVPPEGLDVSSYRKQLHQRYGVIIAGGQGKMKGKLIRVGHLGAIQEGDLVQVLWAMEQALEDLDIRPNEGRGVTALITRLEVSQAIAGARA
jgi:aspartate aminotransferase-like enzyme